MWVLLSAGLRRWLLVTVALPLAGAAAARLARSVEEHHGAGRLSRTLGAVSTATGRARRDRKAAGRGRKKK